MLEIEKQTFSGEVKQILKIFSSSRNRPKRTSYNKPQKDGQKVL